MRKRRTIAEERSFFPIFDLYPGLELQWANSLPITIPPTPVIEPSPAIPAFIPFPPPGRKTPLPKPLVVATEPHTIAHKSGHRILVKPGAIGSATRPSKNLSSGPTAGSFWPGR